MSYLSASPWLIPRSSFVGTPWIIPWLIARSSFIGASWIVPGLGGRSGLIVRHLCLVLANSLFRG
jgi:hypothetical protein